MTPTVSNFYQVKGVFDNGGKSVYCIDPFDIKEPLLITTIQQAREFYDVPICKKNAPKLLSRFFKDFTKSEIAQRFNRWIIGKEHLTIDE